jgi:hypothetical protein
MRIAPILAFLSLLPVAGAVAADQIQGAQASVPKKYGIVPFRPHGYSVAPQVTSVTPQCNSPKLSYFNGPVVSNVQVVPVLWGSHVNAQVVGNIAQFYADATVSSWYNVLSEYASVGGTNQSIGAGTSIQAVAITPAQCSGTANCTVTDAQIQSELASQIANNQLPQPQTDFTGNTTTAYMVHFPPNVTIDASALGAGKSCIQFCAYHNTATFGSGNLALPYGVLPDEFTSACSQGCGGNASSLQNTTDTASHELAEIVTDPDIGLDTSFNYAYPAGWGDNNNSCGEIADICDSGGAGDTITVGGNSWVVQELWSNAQGKCTSSGPSPTLAVAAPSTIPAGMTFTFSVTAKNPTGSNGVDTAYVGVVHFSSSDPNAVLPADFTFTPANQGTASFSATLNTAGSQTISANGSASGPIVVSADNSTTALSTVCATTFVENQSIMLTAVVSGSNPTGNVSFQSGATVFCAAAQLTSASASCQTPVLTVQGGGTSSAFEVVANYGGDGANAASSSAPLALTVLSAADAIFRGGFETIPAGCPTH